MNRFSVLILALIPGQYLSGYVYCQKARIVNLRVNIISPLKNSFIKSPGSVNVQFSVYNQGPDVVKPSDTIIFYPKSNDTLFKYKRAYSTKIIQAGDSEIFNVLIPHNASYDNNFYNLGITALYAYNKSPDSVRSEPLSWQKDNTFFITVRHRSATSNINLIQSLKPVKTYPNPANNFVIIDLTNIKLSALSRIFVSDLHGGVVKNYNIPIFSKEINLPIMELANGIYIISVITPNSVYNSKLIVNHL